MSRNSADGAPTRWFQLPILLGAMLPLAAATAADVAVEQLHRSFSIGTVTVSRGSRIRFINVDDFDHEVYVDTPGFSYDSFEQSPGAVAVVTFSRSGSFEVRCHIHPRMHLHVEVVDGN